MTFSPTSFSRVATIALIFLYLIVITGATVRLTGSGLGCPDWPTCTSTRPVPEIEYHGLIEFFNRMMTLPTSVATLAALWMSFRLREPRRDLRIGSTLAVLGVVIQIVLGALTVKLQLPWLVVSLHFLVSIAILSGATYTAYAARQAQPVRLRLRGAPLIALASGVMLAACAVVILLGVITTASGPHSGAGSVEGLGVERLGNSALAVTLHARAAWTFAVLVVLLTLARRRTRAGARDVTALTALVVVQIALGEIQYRNGLPWQVVLAHVATAAVIWIVANRVAIAALTLEATPIIDEPEVPPAAGLGVTGRSDTVPA